MIELVSLLTINNCCGKYNIFPMSIASTFRSSLCIQIEEKPDGDFIYRRCRADSLRLPNKAL